MADVSADELTDEDGAVDPDAVNAHIDALYERADADRERVEAMEEPPESSEAIRYLRDGVGEAIGTYIVLRTGGRQYRFGPGEFERLEVAMNVWLRLFAASQGVDLDAEFSLRTAAEALLETNDLRATAEMLTGIRSDPR